MTNQDVLRNEVKRLKWEEDINYKTIAEDLLDMSYHAFINWLHKYRNLSQEKAKKLESFVFDMKE